jgi:predicted nucleic acid-binding Zn ribbon protein
MERAGKVLLRSKVPADCVAPDMLMLACWPAAVGKTIAARTKAVKLVRDHLVVEVEDSVWQGQLIPLRNQILAALARSSGSDVVKSLEFRVAPPRRMPVRETAVVRAGDPERVDDPVLRRIYATNRKKALA